MDVWSQMLFKRVMPSSGWVASTAAATLLLVGCGGELRPAQPSGPPLPAYTARDAQLFDDGVEAEALGYELSGSSGKDEKLLADRVDASDGVVRARIVTITSKAEDSGQGILLGMHALETLAGRRAPSGDFTLLASARSPAAGLLAAAESRLVGLTLVVFVRGFAPTDLAESDGVLHFHLARDEKDEQDRVRAASLGPLH